MSVVTGIALIVFVASATEDKEYTNSIGMRMVRIGPGTFPMGSLNPTPPEKLQGPKHLPNGDWDEKPVHSVTISKPFYISETEITIEQFQKFRPDYEDHGWFRDGIKKWEWDHREDSTSVWNQWWPNGRKKAESSWRDRKCEGTAMRWDKSGKVISKHEFADGKTVSSDG